MKASAKAREYDNKGIIPLPGESRDEFFARAEKSEFYMKRMQRTLKKGKLRPYLQVDPDDEWNVLKAVPVEIYKFGDPQVPVIELCHESKTFEPWWGGFCHYVYRDGIWLPLAVVRGLDKSDKKPFPELRHELKKFSTAAHEIVHGVRTQFQNPAYKDKYDCDRTYNEFVAQLTNKDLEEIKGTLKKYYEKDAKQMEKNCAEKYKLSYTQYRMFYLGLGLIGTTVLMALLPEGLPAWPTAISVSLPTIVGAVAPFLPMDNGRPLQIDEIEGSDLLDERYRPILPRISQQEYMQLKRKSSKLPVEEILNEKMENRKDGWRWKMIYDLCG
jgi:hypothetical protein